MTSLDSTGDAVVISARDVGVTYSRRSGLFQRRRVPVLQGVSFDVRRGETLAIIGRNGAGKTTLMKLLAGIIAPDAGRIEMNGVRTSLLSLRLGFTHYLTGRENAILSGLLLGVSRARIEEGMEEIIAFSELREVIDDPIGTYSTGMVARLGFAVSFIAEPDVLLVDEVLGVGDAAFQKKSRKRMEELIGSDKTVVLATHAVSTIRTLADRALWIEAGHVRELGNAEEVLKRYAEAQGV